LLFLIKKVGAIYITSATDPTLSNCVFSNNKASSSDFGNVVYNSDNNNVNSPSIIINTCSINSNQRITEILSLLYMK
jgi:hypothetical protein